MNAPVTVAVDGTEAGRRALRYGIELAASVGSPLRLVHVRHENIVLAPMMPLLPDPTLDEIAERVMSAAVADARQLGWTGPPPEMVRGRAPRVPAIVEAARGSRCVVLGTRSSTPAHLFTGATTNGVAAHADVPVVCVPERWDPAVHYRTVSVGVACDATATPVLEVAAAVADDMEAVLQVVHAWRPAGQYDAAITGHSYVERWEQEMRAVIDDLIRPMRAAHPQVKMDVQLDYERPATALHRMSEGSDLVVVGRHAAPAWQAQFGPRLGSTARTVIRTSSCPVLVVPTRVDG
jgi:nucleotide-binding universal stress UspA family protein